MQSNKGVVLTVLTVIGLAFVAAWTLGGNWKGNSDAGPVDLAVVEDPEPESNRSAAAHTMPRRVSASESEADTDPDPDQALYRAVKRMENAANAVAMAEALEELEQIDDAIAQARWNELRVYCHPGLIEHALASRSSLVPLAQFCDGFEFGDWGQDQESERRNSRLAEVALLNEMFVEAVLENTPEQEISDVLTDLMRESTTPELLLQVWLSTRAPQNRDWREGLWDFGRQVLERYPEADLLEAQHKAILLYRCQRFGGCGGNQWFSIHYCYMYLGGRCRPGSSLDEMLFQTTPPATYNLALEILAQL